MPLSPREEQQLLAIEAQLVADSPDLNRVLRSGQGSRRKRSCGLAMVLGALMMSFGFLAPVLITIGFVLCSTAFFVLIGPCLLGPGPPSKPRA